MKKIFRRLLRYALYIAALLFLSSLGYILYLRWFPPFNTPLMLARGMDGSIEGGPVNIHYRWRSYSHISPQMKVAVMAAEDQKFPYHNGFDAEAIEKAIEHNMHSERIRGASTISQQVAKNVFLWQGRSYLRKGLEVYFTVMIELLWGKERILEMYLNIAEMGDGIFGVEAAAQKYWHIDASQLSTSQAAALASILPDPRRLSPVKMDNATRTKQGNVIRLMRTIGGTGVLKEL